jgi:hypothetical protein
VDANLTGIIEKVSTYAGVQTVQDLSDTKDRYGKIVVQFKKLTPDEEKKLVHKITDYLSAKENYVLNFTRRFKDETGQGQATMKALTLVQAFTSWISWRTKLEQRACEYWIGEDRKEIRRLELLVQASDLIDTIAGWMWMNPEAPSAAPSTQAGQTDTASFQPMGGADKVFYTTGRLTSEMVIKSAQMGVPVVVSRSGMTQMGLDVAQRVGLCAIGRATNKRFLCFTHPQRLVMDAVQPLPELV